MEFKLILFFAILYYFIAEVSLMILIVFPPKKIGIYGYRTTRSIKNTSNWKYANLIAPKLGMLIFFIGFLIMLIIIVSFRKWITLANLELFIFSIIIGIVINSIIFIVIVEGKLKKFEQEQNEG